MNFPGRPKIPDAGTADSKTSKGLFAIIVHPKCRDLVPAQFDVVMHVQHDLGPNASPQGTSARYPLPRGPGLATPLHLVADVVGDLRQARSRPEDRAYAQLFKEWAVRLWDDAPQDY